MLNTNSLYYTENPYRWEYLQEEQTESELSSLADRLLGDFYEAYYRRQIKRWDWKQIREDAENNPQTSMDGDSYGSCFIGTVFDLNPSGKYWTCWAMGNVDRLEAIQDTAFTEALDSIANSRDMWIESGEGDPCDLYACIGLDSDESEDL
jgi:hypothetical protein